MEQPGIETTRGLIDVDGNYNELHVFASVEETADALSKLRNATGWQQQVDQRGVTLPDHGCLIIQFKDHQWSQVLDNFWNQAHLNEAQELSRILKTKAMHFSYSDTAGAFEYTLFESGDRQEHLSFCEGAVEKFESTLRKVNKKQIKKQRSDFVDDFFKEQGLLAACIAYSVLIPFDQSGSGQHIEFNDLGWYQFNRIDYLELPPPVDDKVPNPVAI